MAPLTIERVTVPDLDPSKFAKSTPPAPEPQPRPRKPKKRRVEQAVPQYFLHSDSQTLRHRCGGIEKSWFIVQDGLVFLCDAAGIVNGEGRAVERNDPTWTARQMLRGRRMSRPGAAIMGSINYPPR